MLPKGERLRGTNARLLFRDGRFIVTGKASKHQRHVRKRPEDAQATIVREGDSKIYIGAFVLRLETNGMAVAANRSRRRGAAARRSRSAPRPRCR